MILINETKLTRENIPPEDEEELQKHLSQMELQGFKPEDDTILDSKRVLGQFKRAEVPDRELHVRVTRRAQTRPQAICPSSVELDGN